MSGVNQSTSLKFPGLPKCIPLSIVSWSKSLNISEDEVLEKMKSLVPVHRLGKIDEYGYLVSFLSSDKAAYINGASIPIDGGLLKSY